jgi:hypothetical protein
MGLLPVLEIRKPKLRELISNFSKMLQKVLQTSRRWILVWNQTQPLLLSLLAKIKIKVWIRLHTFCSETLVCPPSPALGKSWLGLHKGWSRIGIAHSPQRWIVRLAGGKWGWKGGAEGLGSWSWGARPQAAGIVEDQRLGVQGKQAGVEVVTKERREQLREMEGRWGERGNYRVKAIGWYLQAFTGRVLTVHLFHIWHWCYLGIF